MCQQFFKKRKQYINNDKVSLSIFSLTVGLFNRYLKWIGNFVYWEVWSVDRSKNSVNRICQSISLKRVWFGCWIAVYIQNVVLLFPLLCNESGTSPNDSEIFLWHFHFGSNRKLHSTKRLWSIPFFSTQRLTTSLIGCGSWRPLNEA